MGLIDIVLIILLVSAAISGFINGFFVELASVVSLILGIWAGIEFSSLVQQWLTHYLTWGKYSMGIVSFILIFIFVALVVHLIAALTEKFVRKLALSIFSRIAGSIFGTLKAAFIISVLMIVVSRIEEQTVTIIPEKAKAGSKLYRPVERMAPNIFPFFKAFREQPQGQPTKNPTT